MKALVSVALAIAIMAPLHSAFAATAFFTGKQEMVTTVTYQSAWRCEYNYLGHMMYFIFKGTCPSTVEVQ